MGVECCKYFSWGSGLETSGRASWRGPERSGEMGMESARGPISGVLGKQSAGLLGGWGRNREGFLESDPGRPIPTKEGDTDPEVC